MMWRVRFGDGIETHPEADGMVEVRRGGKPALVLAPPSAEAAAALEALAGDGLAEDDWQRVLPGPFRAGLARHRLLVWTAGAVVAAPLADGWTPRDDALPAAARPSRFCLLRPGPAGGAVLESPLTEARLTLSADAAAEVGRLLAGGESALLAVLWRAGFCETAEPESRAPWEFHDLLFHAATRSGRDGVPLGPTGRGGRFAQPAAIRPSYPGAEVVLPPLDVATLAARSHPTAVVMEERRSRRDYGAVPVTLEQVGELLFRTVRIRGVRSAGGVDYVDRPLPCGGGLQELEYYVAVHACRGLAPGFYHYRGADHALTLVAGPSLELDRLLREAGRYATRRDEPPQVVVVTAARLARLAWKYETLAYRLVLLNAGVAMQTMHLAAEDMGLGVCAVGTGNPRLFAALTGCDPFAETSVAEVVIGSVDHSPSGGEHGKDDTLQGGSGRT